MKTYIVKVFYGDKYYSQTVQGDFIDFKGNNMVMICKNNDKILIVTGNFMVHELEKDDKK